MIESQKPWGDGEYAIAHLSDLHFGSKNYKEVWKLTAQHLEAIKPDLLLVTGDLVDTPKKRLYAEVKESLENLRIPYHVCAGNHDRFYHGNQFPPWTKWVARLTLVALVWLVGGLLYSSLAWFWVWFVVMGAVAAAGWKWTVRPLWALTQFSDQFAEVFQGRILIHDEVKLVRVPRQASTAGGRAESGWTVGLFGDDSNAWADASARGYVPNSHFMPIIEATKSQNCELCLFLVHHHLLSIRRLEEGRFNKLGALFDLTNMVNAGSLLETLAKAHVDLVLHGHEHEPNFAAYGSLTAGSGEVKVIAAGSATGNRSLGGCGYENATFNVLILAIDRSVRLGRYWLEAEQWRYGEMGDIEASALRLNRLRRLHPSLEDIDSENTRYFEFNRKREIWVYWVVTDLRLPSKEFVQEVRNSTGWLDVDDLEVRIWVSPSPPMNLAATAKRLPDKPNTWLISAEVPEGFAGLPVQLEMKYCWRDGAILTMEEMDQTKEWRQEQGTPRSREYEFVMGRIRQDSPAAAMAIIVALPPEYAPNPAGTTRAVEVFVERDGHHIRHQEIELLPHLQILSPSMFALRVAYPQADHDYQLAWKPVPQEQVNKMMHNEEPLTMFAQLARPEQKQKGKELLEAFRDQLKNSSFPACSSLALYVSPTGGKSILHSVECIGWQNEVELDCDVTPPSAIQVIGSQHMLARAWWGEPYGLVRPEDEVEALQTGFLPKERVVFGVPIRLSLGSTNPPPWGVVRIGITGPETVSQDLEKLKGLSTILLAAATFLLYTALSSEYITSSERDQSAPRTEESK